MFNLICGADPRTKNMKKSMIIAAIAMAAVTGMTSCSSARYAEYEAYNKAYQKEAVIAEAPAEAETDDFVEVNEAEELAAAQAAEAPAVETPAADIEVEGDGTIVIDKTGSKESATAKARRLATRVVKDVEYVQDKKTGAVIGENVLRDNNLNGFHAIVEGTGIYFNDRVNFGGGAGFGVSTPHFETTAVFGIAQAVKNKDDVNAGQSITSWYAHAGAMYCMDLTPKGQLYGKWQFKIGVDMFFYRRQLEEDISPDLIIDEGVNVEVLKVKGSTVYHRGFTFAPCAKIAIDGRLTYNLHLQASAFAGPTSEYFKGGSRGRWCGGTNLSLICYFNTWKEVNSSVGSSARQLSSYNNNRINQMRASQRR